jgi:hypothetical protein
VEPLSRALEAEKWSLVQPLFTSSYTGFGTSSLKEVILSAACNYDRLTRENQRVRFSVLKCWKSPNLFTGMTNNVRLTFSVGDTILRFTFSIEQDNQNW